MHEAMSCEYQCKALLAWFVATNVMYSLLVQLIPSAVSLVSPGIHHPGICQSHEQQLRSPMRGGNAFVGEREMKQLHETLNTLGCMTIELVTSVVHFRSLLTTC